MKKERSLLKTEFYKIRNSKSWRCLIEGCENQTSKNHLLQKNGILNQITFDSHLYEYNVDFFRDPIGVEFVRKGINEIFTIRALCQNHDDEVFSFLEKNQIDTSDYASQILLSFRAAITEIRKDEIIMKWHDKLQAKHISNLLNSYYKSYNQQLILKTNDSKKYLNQLIYDLNDVSNLKDTNRRFIFKKTKIPRFDICASGIFNFIGAETNYLNNILIHIIPTRDSLDIIIGCHKDSDKEYKEYVNNFENLEIDIKLEYITDILLTKIENWVFSRNFYENQILPKHKYILDLISTHFKLPGLFKNIEKRLMFNLFDLKNSANNG